MDGRGGCCIARYSGGGGGMSKVERIMLKFRPIAPKPLAAGSGSSSSTVDHSDGYGGTRRRKRKYVRVNGSNKAAKEDKTTVSKKRKVSDQSSPSVSGGEDAVVTLSLIPETPDRKEKSPARSPSSSSPAENPDLLNRNKLAPVCFDGHVRGAEKHVVNVSFVTMECVTETWLSGDGLGFTDDDSRVMMSIEMDTCPSFITDSRDTVVWTNKAYGEMTAGGVGDDTAPAVVQVVKKYNRVAMPVAIPAFTCKVKVTWGTERSSSLTAPCDVWRLQSGGFAWRLDVEAALSLGR